jgi:hypothetical protein
MHIQQHTVHRNRDSFHFTEVAIKRLEMVVSFGWLADTFEYITTYVHLNSQNGTYAKSMLIGCLFT